MVYPDSKIIMSFALGAVLASNVAENVRGDENSGSTAFVLGVDASFLQRIEDSGGVYFSDGLPADALAIFQSHGVNYVRLRLWHTPGSGYNNLNQTMLMAQRVKSRGMGLVLDLHYSDTWADPSHQVKPAAWASLSFNELITAVHDYTQNVVTALKNKGALPDIIQIGNETTYGCLWDDGRVGGSFEGNWSQFAALLNAAIAGVNDSLDAGQSVRIMPHIDRGGDNATCRWFFDNILARGVTFDIIGLSFYPWWHGTLTELQQNLDDLAVRYEKEIIVVETAYPWTLDWFDGTNNIVGLSSQLHVGFPATVEGQRDFLCTLTNIVRDAPQDKGIGLMYWAPDWISTAGMGSAWENLALFDFGGHALDSMHVLSKRFTGFDLGDFAALQRCFTGPGGSPSEPACIRFDFDCDNDLDIEDYAEIAAALTGP